MVRRSDWWKNGMPSCFSEIRVNFMCLFSAKIDVTTGPSDTHPKYFFIAKKIGWSSNFHLESCYSKPIRIIGTILSSMILLAKKP